MSLFNELKRRNVFRVAIGYTVSCWLLVQVADLALETIGAPAWVLQTLMLFMGLGLPVVVFFSWAYEVTPEGIKREAEVDRSQSITHVTGRKLDRAIVAMLVVALGYFIWEARFAGNDASTPPQPRELVETVAEGGPGEDAGAVEEAPAEPPIDRLSVAVLPFDNRSNNPDDEFFTEGIHDDLLTSIAKIGSLKVISRTSVLEYKDTTKKIPDIARELRVANVLEGGVQRSGNQVRVNVQLIDAETDQHLWAEIFDRELTAENLFAIQSEISRAIADALQATLTLEEADRIDAVPTENLQAYDAYLRGKQLMATRDSENLKRAIGEFDRAVELDPEFALAWVGVADSNHLYTLYAATDSEEYESKREQALDRALALDDGLGEAYASLGSLLSNRNRNEEAEAAFLKAIELSPNYATAYQWYASLLERYLSRVDERLALTRQAVELDPRSAIIGVNLAAAYESKGLLSLAERQYLNVIDIHPEFAPANRMLAGLYTFRMGEYAKALSYLFKGDDLDPGSMPTKGMLHATYAQLGDWQAAGRIKERMVDLDSDHITVGFAEVFGSAIRGNDAGAREAINWLLPKVRDNLWVRQSMGMIMLGLGDKDRAREIYLSAVPGWQDASQWPDLMDRFDIHGCVVSWIFIHTSDEEKGARLLQEATSFFDNRLALVNEHVDYFAPEACYLAKGEIERGLQSIETQLEHNHLADWEVFHRLPMYDLVRHEPRYQAVLQERQRRVAAQREAVALQGLDTD